MKKWGFFFVCIFGLGLSTCIFYPKFKQKKLSPKQKHLKETFGPYFFSVPVEKFTKSDLPCITIELDNKKVLVELDLGFRGESVFPKEMIENISQKTFIGEQIMYGVRGKGYKEKKYRAPKIHIKNVTISDSIMHEESEELVEDSCILTDENNCSSKTLRESGMGIIPKLQPFLRFRKFKHCFLR